MASQPFLPARKPHHGAPSYKSPSAAQTNQPLTILPPPLTAALQADLQQHYLPQQQLQLFRPQLFPSCFAFPSKSNPPETSAT